MLGGAYNMFRRRSFANPQPKEWADNFAGPVPRPDLGNCGDCDGAFDRKDLRGSPPCCKPCRRIRRDR